MLRDETKKNQLQKVLKAKQIAIKRIRTRIWYKYKLEGTFNFWKGCHEIQSGDIKKRKDKEKSLTKPTYWSTVLTRWPLWRAQRDASNTIMKGSIWLFRCIARAAKKAWEPLRRPFFFNYFYICENTSVSPQDPIVALLCTYVDHHEEHDVALPPPLWKAAFDRLEAPHASSKKLEYFRANLFCFLFFYMCEKINLPLICL